MECHLLVAPAHHFLDTAPPSRGDVVGTTTSSFPSLLDASTGLSSPGVSLFRSLESTSVCPELAKLCCFSYRRPGAQFNAGGANHLGRKRRKIAFEEPPALIDHFSPTHINVEVKVLRPGTQDSHTQQSQRERTWPCSSCGEAVGILVAREGHVHIEELTHAIDNRNGCGCCGAPAEQVGRREEPSHMLGWDGPLKGDRLDENRNARPASYPSLENGFHIASIPGNRKVDLADDLKVLSRTHSASSDFIRPGDLVHDDKVLRITHPDCGADEEGQTRAHCWKGTHCQEEMLAAELCQGSWDFEVLASVQCQNQQLTSTDVIGAIAFEKTNDFFATGGIARKIRVYAYQSLLSGLGPVDDDDEDEEEEESKEYLKQRRLRKRLHKASDIDQWKFADHARCCVTEVCTPAKLSSLQWHQERGHVVACGDYDGVVAEWDVERSLAVSERDEHGGQRIWSIDYSKDFPDLIASACDDGTVRMWDRSSEQSVAMLRSPSHSPICCAEFGPASSSLLALASADSNVYVYDTRNQAFPLLTLRHHKRAASYVRFLSRQRIVSSSVDSSVKLWDITEVSADQYGGLFPTSSQNQPIKTYDAHRNVRNFTGLSVWDGGGLIACGSETNQAFAYDCRRSSPILVHDFGEAPASAHRDSKGPRAPRAVDSMIVSAVCWRKKLDDCTLVAANSDGVLRVIAGRQTRSTQISAPGHESAF